MTLAKHLLLLLTVATLAANPAMACCLGDNGPSLAQVPGPATQSRPDAALPPCHSLPATAPSEAAQQRAVPRNTTATAGPTLCPGCLDCDSSALVPTGTAKPSQDRPATDADQITERPAHWAERPPPVLIRVHGPPPAAPATATTPVSLQQLLLI